MIKEITKSSAWLMTFMTQKDCATLKKLIVENPEAPLLIFAGENAICEKYAPSTARDYLARAEKELAEGIEK